MPGEKTSQHLRADTEIPVLGRMTKSTHWMTGFDLALLLWDIHIQPTHFWKADVSCRWLQQLQHLLCMLSWCWYSSAPTGTFLPITPGSRSAVSWANSPTVPKLARLFITSSFAPAQNPSNSKTKARNYLNFSAHDRQLLCYTVIKLKVGHTELAQPDHLRGCRWAYLCQLMSYCSQIFTQESLHIILAGIVVHCWFPCSTFPVWPVNNLVGRRHRTNIFCDMILMSWEKLMSATGVILTSGG